MYSRGTEGASQSKRRVLKMNKEQMIKQLEEDIKRWRDKLDNAVDEFEQTKAITYLKHYKEELNRIKTNK